MKVTSLVDNISNQGMPTEHGLSLLVEFESGEKLLFDMGQGTLFCENAKRLGIDISDVDMAVISHGHYDHGGGLATFLAENTKANVFVHKDAFQPHYSLRESGLTYIGLDTDLKDNPRIVKCFNSETINSNTILYAGVHGNCCLPPGNSRLFKDEDNHNDTFTDEQNLIIMDDENTLLFAGCAHSGIINIMREAEKKAHGRIPTHVFGGFHLTKTGLSKDEEEKYIQNSANELHKYPDTTFYTMHCTGLEAFSMLHSLLGSQIQYLSCGESVSIVPLTTLPFSKSFPK